MQSIVIRPQIDLTKLTLLLLLAITLLTLCSCSKQSYFTNRETALRKQFFQNEIIFNQIVEMKLEDTSLVRIAPTFTRLENDYSWPRKNIGITNTRWNEYRSLFTSGDIKYGIQSYPKSISVYANEAKQVDFMIDGDPSGISYTETPPSKISNSFADCLSKPGQVCYVFLKENWYLYLN